MVDQMLNIVEAIKYQLLFVLRHTHGRRFGYLAGVSGEGNYHALSGIRFKKISQVLRGHIVRIMSRLEESWVNSILNSCHPKSTAEVKLCCCET